MSNLKLLVKFIQGQSVLSLFVILISISCTCSMSEETNKPSYLVGRVGSHVVFNCPIEFPQDIVIPYILHWSKDGKKVFSWYDGTLTASNLFVGRLNLLDKMEGYGKASVNLTSIRESDQGWYECKVLFPNRSPQSRNNGTWFYLTVEGGSLIKIPPVNQTIMEGQTAFLTCVMKSPETSTITWFKDGTEITEWHELASRSRRGPDGSLSIDPTMMSDLGEYECVVTSSEGEQQSARAFLNIQYKAKVIYAPSEVYLPYGQPAVLDCHYRSNPPLKNLKWEKDGFLYDPFNVKGVYKNQYNGSLYFSKVDESHAGRYACTPQNELGTDGPSPLINVIVTRPPVFTLKPKPIYIHKLGEDAEMACDAIDTDGTHRPTIIWSRKDGTPLPVGRYQLDGGNITLQAITESERGIYQCVATNEAATVTADTELMIENVAPRPPYNLTANSSDTAITLRWQPGKIGLKPNLEYIVWYRLTDAAEWRTMKIMSRNVMEATINNLTPGREYEFMVLSQDRYGDGMFSKAFRYQTQPKQFTEAEQFRDPILPFSQIGPPRNLTVEFDSDGFQLTWEPPEYGRESLRVYIVRWYQEPEHFLHGTAETRDLNYLVRYLKEDTVYSFQVFSLSTSDYQVGSNEVEILVPSQRKFRAIAIGSAVGLIFFITAVGVFVYVRKNCFKHLKSSSDKISS